MRPHHLVVEAFGPFADRVEVDFDTLGEAGLFLLHGETGAGKTTLLDAIGYALYGTVPGQRAEARRLRSDHADPTRGTRVQLEATLGGRRLRVTRSPAWERPKRRGRGTTAEPARVQLEERRDGEWVTLSTRTGEADEEIALRMGMSADQFFQVVLLPQGDFARFLRARADDRTRLLEQLFGTARFRSAEAWLANRRRETERRAEAARSELDRLLARVAQVADAEPPAGATEVGGWSQARADAAAAAAADGERERLRLRAALDRALADEDRCRDLADRQQRRHEALRRSAELAAAAPEITACVAELDAASRAAEVAGTLDAAREAGIRLDTATARWDGALAAATAAGAPEVADEGTLQKLEAAALRRAGVLGTVAGRIALVRAEEEAARDADARAAEAEVNARDARVLLDGLPARRARLEAEREAAVAAGRRLADARLRADRLTRAAADASALRAARADQDRLERDHHAARGHALDLAERAHGLREARFDAMVYELAAKLTDDAPCPVCGSLTHPDPSELRGGRVSVEQEEEAVRAAEAARAAAERIGAEAAAARERVAQLAGRLAAVRPPDDLTVDLTDADEAARLAHEADADVGRVAAQADRGAGVDAELARLAEEEGRAGADVARLTEQASQLSATAREAGRRAATAREGVVSELGARGAWPPERVPTADELDVVLGDARRDVTSSAELFRAAAQAAADLREAAAETVRASDRAQRAARAAGFAGADAARAARRDDAWRQEARRLVEEHRAAEAAVAALLVDPALDVPLDPPADTTGAAAAVAAARTAHDGATAETGRLAARAEDLAALAPRVAEAAASLRPVEERAAEARALADLANGTGANTLRMTLSAFVLAARLEEVAAVASVRLHRMTAGRYTLAHTDTGRRGNGRSGLGLLVRDAWTGVDRDTSTLSGGETFLASLALALGLADVVTAEAGGTGIDALFVDEGFGTLDEETLEEVMGVLDGLREGGRLVGVVSHVPELRHRIPTQVRVHKGRDGSSLAMSTG